MTVISNLSVIKQALEKKSVFIFDFDGVIVDSNDIKGSMFAKLYEHYGKEIENKVRNYHSLNPGVSRFDKMSYFHKNFLNKELTLEDLNLICDRFSDLVMEKVVVSKEIQGAKKFLKNSFYDGKLCFINSATPTNELRSIVKKRSIDLFFSGVYGSPSSKENNLKEILKKTSTDIEDCIFFGDALSDFNAAKSVSMDFIGIGQSIASSLNKMEGSYFALDNFRAYNNGA